MRVYLTALLCCLGILALSGCSRSPEVVKVALVMPFEGPERAKGYDALYAARLAVREINAAGGVNGRYLALVALDDSGDPELASRVARSVVADPAILAVIGHGMPTTTEAGAAIYTAADLPLLTLETPFPSDQLPATFQAAYAAVTPFDETAGPLAAPTYDQLQLIAAALEQSEANSTLTRARLAALLQESEIQGITGSVHGNRP